MMLLDESFGSVALEMPCTCGLSSYSLESGKAQPELLTVDL
jgi:hypothetical protein